MAKLFILGSGPFAREVAVYYRIDYDVDVLYVDNNNTGEDIITIDEYHEMVESARPNNIHYSYSSIMGTGKPDIKLRMLKQILEPIASINLSRRYGWDVPIGAGSVIADNTTLAPYTEIGGHVLINYNASVGHNTKIGMCSTVSPGAAIGGNCNIGKGVLIGANASIKEYTNIGDGAIVAMGAVVINDIPAGFKVKGVPAKPFGLPGLQHT